MKKIIQVFGSLDAGGAESRMMDVFRAIDKTKYQFIFVTLDPKDGQFYESEIARLGGQVIKISSPRVIGIRRHFGELVKIFSELHKEGVDVVHAHTSYHCGVVLTAAKRAGISVRIAHARTTSSINKNSAKEKFTIFLGKTLIKMFATTRLALNEETSLALYGCKPDGEKVRVLPNAIDLKRYEDPEGCPDLSDISDATTVIGHIGRFQPMKNHRFIIDFFKEFKASNPDSLLVLVGDGPLRKEIEGYVEASGLSDKVRFMGLRKDIPSILKSIDLFILPSFYEGLVGSVLEAQASGVTCLVSDTVPRNVDMNLGLVHFLNLDKPESWQKAAEEALAVCRPSYGEITKSFNERGFTLDSEINQLTAIYENTYNNHHHL